MMLTTLLEYYNITNLNLRYKFLLKCPICKHSIENHEHRKFVEPKELRDICWGCHIYVYGEEGYRKFTSSSYHKFPDNLEIVEQLVKERKLL
jgi:hypothetical protein